MEITQINDALKVLEMAEPLIDFEDPGPIKPFHFEALALMYSHEGYRSFLKMMYNNAVKSAALRSSNEVDIAFGKAQALTYKKLLIDAKKAFEHIERLKKARQNAREENT
jgi:hypothetical protein